jgi:EmrB/QacA subfamily drug resistance transporter
MLSTSLVALDATVIATAVPSVVESIGGFAQFPWLFSIYLLAQAVSVPVYGKVADVAGRKPVLLAGIATFGLGSVLCGAAWSMPTLIAARAVQGLGAGAVQPMSVTVVGDMYTLDERARVQGYLASVWGGASVLGPALGGAFAEYVSWRWIFFLNVPLCVIAGVMLSRHFQERAEPVKRRIDGRGALLVSTGLGLTVLGVLEGGEAWPWLSSAGIGVPTGGVLLLVLFVLVERRAQDPVVPLWVFRRRRLVTSNVIAACVGGVVIGLTSYLPTYAQGVLGVGPLTAGFALAALLLAWPAAATQAGRVYLRAGFRRCATIGAAAVLIGCAILVTLGRTSSMGQVAAACFVIGCGMGWVATPTMIAAQASVGWAERGTVTAMNLFFRSLGSALSVAIFGAIANAVIRGGHAGAPDVARLMTASSHVFVGVAVAAILLSVAVFWMPSDRHGTVPTPDA